jgi:hypothetical protein
MTKDYKVLEESPLDRMGTSGLLNLQIQERDKLVKLGSGTV